MRENMESVSQEPARHSRRPKRRYINCTYFSSGEAKNTNTKYNQWQ